MFVILLQFGTTVDCFIALNSEKKKLTHKHLADNLCNLGSVVKNVNFCERVLIFQMYAKHCHFLPGNVRGFCKAFHIFQQKILAPLDLCAF